MLGVQNSDKRKNGFIDVYVYLYSATESKMKEMEREAEGWCLQHRYIPHYKRDLDSRDTLKDLMYLEKVDKTYGLVIYSPENVSESEEETLSILFLISTRGIKTFDCMSGWEIPPYMLYVMKRFTEINKQRVQDCRKKMAREGIYLNHDTPFGYRKNDGMTVSYMKGDMIQDKYEAFIVRYVYYRHELGYGAGSIARELTMRGFTNRAGKEFNVATVRKILKNKDIYMGYLTQEGIRAKGKYTPLLDENGKVDMSYIGNRFDVEKEARQAKKARQRKKIPHTIKPCERRADGVITSL